MRYYIATRLENHAAHNQVRDWLTTLGHEITYDWTQHGPVWSAGIERLREVATLEEQGVRDADVVIVLLTDPPSGRGTHVELGLALARRIPIVIHTPSSRLAGADPDTCAFYHRPSVVWAFGALETVVDVVEHVLIVERLQRSVARSRLGARVPSEA